MDSSTKKQIRSGQYDELQSKLDTLLSTCYQHKAKAELLIAAQALKTAFYYEYTAKTVSLLALTPAQAKAMQGQS